MTPCTLESVSGSGSRDAPSQLDEIGLVASFALRVCHENEHPFCKEYRYIDIRRC